MRAVVQRVSRASVRVGDREIARIARGLLLLVGFSASDGEDVIHWMARKVASLRIFEDDRGKMNLDYREVGGKLLVVSQFTLYGDCSKGKRPGFDRCAPAEEAAGLYRRFLEALEREAPGDVASGEFQAHMEVEFVNDGPVTLIIDKEAGGSEEA